MPDGLRHPMLDDMNLILLQSSELDGDRVVLTDHRAVHIQNILRSPPGDTLRIGLLNGPRGTGTVESVNDREVALRCSFAEEPPPRPRIDLVLGMPRPKVMKRSISVPGSISARLASAAVQARPFRQ